VPAKKEVLIGSRVKKTGRVPQRKHGPWRPVDRPSALEQSPADRRSNREGWRHFFSAGAGAPLGASAGLAAAGGAGFTTGAGVVGAGSSGLQPLTKAKDRPSPETNAQSFSPNLIVTKLLLKKSPQGASDPLIFEPVGTCNWAARQDSDGRDKLATIVQRLIVVAFRILSNALLRICKGERIFR
jgi:hypothetical protein